MPLNWSLTQTQKDAIQREWERLDELPPNDNPFAKLDRYFDNLLPPKKP